ncbi:zinc ribbon domain-containing protein [Planococcus sp. 1R117A]|uniref:zinc ribbon domain-containing protein n=1 Tax=Planococcus sp. 1R117A TaxID=3447020 RepID=UPI003EDC5FF4
MFCKECGAKHPSFINYCPNDGQELTVALPFAVGHKNTGFCGGCGNSVSASAQYCQSCGESHHVLKVGTVKKVEPSISAKKNLSQSKLMIEPFSTKTFTSILFALGISIVLVIVAAFLLKTEVETALIESADGELTRGQLHSIENYFSTEFESEYDINLELPNIYNIFTYISFMHGIDFELTGEAQEDYSDFFQYGIEVDAQNFSAPLLLITFVLLALSGIALGYFIKRNHIQMWQAIIGFSLLYGIFIAVSSFIASFSYINSIDTSYANVSLSFAGKFPIVESFFSGLILAAAISGSAALITVYGKQTVHFLQTKASYVQYLSFGLMIILGGLFTMAAITFIALSASSAADEIFKTFELSSIALFGSFSIWIWDLAHLLPINLTIKEIGETESYTFHLLESLSDNQSEIVGLFFISEAFPLWVNLSFLLPAALLIGAGYMLYNTHSLKIFETLKFSALYGLFMVVVKLFTSLKFSMTSSSFDELDEFVSARIHTDLLSVFLISAIYALVFFNVGGFLKRYLSE